MSSKHIEIESYISAIVLAIGVFLHLTSLPVIGDDSYDKVTEVESYIIVTATLSATVLNIYRYAEVHFCLRSARLGDAALSCYQEPVQEP